MTEKISTIEEPLGQTKTLFPSSITPLTNILSLQEKRDKLKEIITFNESADGEDPLLKLCENTIYFEILQQVKEDLHIEITLDNFEYFNRQDLDIEKLKQIQNAIGEAINPCYIDELQKLDIDFTTFIPLIQQLKDLNIAIDSTNVSTIIGYPIKFDNLRLLHKLGIAIYTLNIQKLSSLELDEKKIEELQGLGCKDSDSLLSLYSLSPEELNKLKKYKEAGFSIGSNIDGFNKLNLTDEEIKFFQKHHINKFSIINFLMVSNTEDIREFIDRKQKYLKNHRTLSFQRFKELFGGSGKYGKTEINQRSLGLCYVYTAFERLKKSNGFDEIIQTNLKESSDGWEVRFPFCSPDGQWIKVHKEDIDQKFLVKDKYGKDRTFIINSESKYLGFKILEIAFIKREILNKAKTLHNLSSNKALNQCYTEYIKHKDFSLIGDAILQTEGGRTRKTLGNIFPSNTTMFLEKLLDSQLQDCAFELFSKGVFHINLSRKPAKILQNKLDSAVSLKKSHEKARENIIVKDVKIINTTGEPLPSRYLLDKKGELFDQKNNYIKRKKKKGYKKPGEKPLIKRFRDIVVDQSGKTMVMFFDEHAYSLEKCYTTKNGEKRVRVINPRHTGIKFDISLEQAKQIFYWVLTRFNIKEMFKEETKKSDSPIMNKS